MRGGNVVSVTLRGWFARSGWMAFALLFVFVADRANGGAPLSVADVIRDAAVGVACALVYAVAMHQYCRRKAL